MTQFKPPCSECQDNGLVSAIKIGTHDRYVFKCSCIFGQSKQQDFPVWMKPTKGFMVEQVEISKEHTANVVCDIRPTTTVVSKNPFDDEDEPS